MFKFFESLTRPFPEGEPERPPSTLFAFCRYYTRGFEAPLIVMSVLTAVIATLEVFLFGFMGQLVDWLVTRNPQTLWQEESGTLITMGVVVAFGIPSLILLHSLVVHQTLLGNYPMAIRWSDP